MRKRLRKLHMKDKQINEDTLGEAPTSCYKDKKGGVGVKRRGWWWS